MVQYADDTYLIVPAANVQSSTAEISNVENWAIINNLALNRAKSAEIVFALPRSRRAVATSPPSLPGFSRVEVIKILGVTITRKFSFKEHIDAVLAGCAQTLFALRTLRNHGLSTDALHAVFQATVVGKLTYASQAWWGFTNAADRNRVEAFLRRAARLGYRDSSAPTMASICAKADDKLFRLVRTNPRHVLHSLLPSRKPEHYRLRERSHSLQLPTRSTSLRDGNFIMRMLYRDI